MYMCVPECMYVYYIACRSLRRSEEGIGSPSIGVRGGLVLGTEPWSFIEQ